MNSPTVRLWIAVAVCALATGPGRGQEAPTPAPPAPAELPEAPEIDPTQPLAPLPDLEVEFPNAGQRPEGARPRSPASETEIDLSYRVEVTGLDAVGLDGRFRALSALEKGDAIDNLAQLDRRAREDAALIDRLLRSEGYYAGQVDTDITPAEAEGGSAVVAIKVDPGARYTFD